MKRYDHLLSPVAGFSRDMTLSYFNAAFAAFFQLSPRKLRGRGLWEILRCDGDEQAALRLAEECQAKGEPVVSGELRLVGGGEPKEAVLKFFPFVVDGGDVQTVVALQDFSIERILHEKHRAQLEELKAKNAEIQTYSEGLEVLVEERTKELRLEKEETDGILRSLSEGLIVVETSLCLSEKSSHAAGALLGHERLAFRPALAVLFPDPDRCGNAEDRRQMESFFASAFNLFVPEQFDDLARYAPRQLRFPDPHGDGVRTYALSYSAVIANDAVVKLVIAVRDDTEIEALRQVGITIHRRIVESLERIAEARFDPAFGAFAREASRLAQASRRAIGEMSTGVLAEVFRHLHTVKGGSRAFALGYLQHFAHAAESALAERQKALSGGNSGADGSRDRGAEALACLQDEVAWLERGFAAVETLCAGERRATNEAGRAWRASVEAIKTAFWQLAEDLGKRARLSFSSSQALPDSERTFLEQVLVHLLRNAVDHGVELPGQRIAVGKHPEAAVSVRVADDGDTISVVVEDDGCGIDRRRLRQLAVARGLLPADAGVLSYDKALDVLATAGFSTRDAVTEVSGRGVGLDAVRVALRERGGDIALLYTGPTGSKFRLFWRKAIALPSAS